MNIKTSLIRILSKKKYSEKFAPQTFKKILIFRQAKIGDTICLFPLIRELKKAFPSTKIDVYASTYNNFMFKNVSQVNHVYTKYRTKHAFKTVLDLLRMRSNKYDLIIDTMELRLSRIIKLIFINAKWVAGVSDPINTNRYDIKVSDLELYYRVNQYKHDHTSDRLLEFLPLLGVNNYDNTMELKINSEAMQFARSFLNTYKQYKLVVLNTEASNQARSLSGSDIVEICHKLKQEDKKILILLFSAREKRDHMKSLIKNFRLDNIILEEGTKNIFDAAALASFMSVIISPDTSFIHIASALDIPTVGIYQNDWEHISVWGPKSKKHIIIKPDFPGNTIKGFSIQKTVSATIQLLSE